MLLSSQLDRSRPLWEPWWFLENLANDRVGLVLKYHHCLLDGASGVSLATLLWDIAPDTTGPLVPAPSAEEQSAGGAPSVVEARGRVTIQVAARPLRVARYVLGGARKCHAPHPSRTMGHPQQVYVSVTAGSCPSS